ncbi:MAG: Ribokinase [Thermomicrobiales bacterium]|jgi:ribokinase|nr:Ribokinase [Thermomicrobiales bacterium]
MSGRVLVIGAVNVDLVVVADRLPGPGQTVVGPTIERHGGGKGANAAVAAARAGADVRYCGAVGADDAGVAALAELRAEGIDVQDVAVLDGVATGTALIVVAPDGENQIAVALGANAKVVPQAVESAVARASGWAHCVLVSTEIPLESIAAAVRSAAAHHIRCVLNPAPVCRGLEDLLPLGPILTPNESELAGLIELLGERQASSPAQMASSISTLTQAPVVVTLGGAGVLVVVGVGPDPTALPARKVEVRDTTGAGDTFNGVFTAALAAGHSILPAARRGVVAASISVGRDGARDGMPNAKTIDEALGTDP